jgi:ankyrin repeat protein
MLAIDTLQPQVIINLICSGADPNQDDNCGKSARDRVKSLSIAKLVIDTVYDINRSDPNGVTALMQASDNLDT